MEKQITLTGESAKKIYKQKPMKKKRKCISSDRSWKLSGNIKKRNYNRYFPGAKK